MEPYESINEWLGDHAIGEKEPLLIVRLRKAEFNDDQILKIINAVFGTCAHCYDDDYGCQCWNDE